MMKASLGRLRRFALNKIDGKDKSEFLPSAPVDELAQAAKDMQDMKDCSDRLLSAAAATANSAYEFSESLREMGSCLENMAQHNDEETGKVLLMLGRVQLELQKLVDNYRSNIFKTITSPSESLLNELRAVEDMKRQCDEKRDVYEYMMAQMKEKGRPKGGKGELLASQQLQTAHSEFNEEATLCIFRSKSLKHGQSRCLLTQATRHHAAQMYLFREGLKSLEAVEQYVRTVAQKQHIDFQISLCGNEMENREDHGEDGRDISEDRELSFDYREDTQRADVASVSRNLMKMDERDVSFPCTSGAEYGVVNSDWKEPRSSVGDYRASSHSAPLFMEMRSDPEEKFRQIQPSTMRSPNTYVLPMPTDSKNTALIKPLASVSNTRSTNHTGHTQYTWHSSPLEQMKNQRDSENSNFSAQLPLPSVDEIQVPHSEASDTQKVKRPTFSGPLTSKPSSTKAIASETSLGVLPRLPVPQSLSPRVSPGASPPLAASPRVSELHELPRPPVNLVPPKRTKSPGVVGHSAPLTAWSQDVTRTNRGPVASTSVASPLPIPPLIFPRSFSIPSRDQRGTAVHVYKLLESPRVPERNEDIATRALNPMPHMSHSSTTVTLPQPGAERSQMRGGS